MAEPSDNTKKTASSMFSRVGKSALGGAKKVASSVGKLFTKKPENVIPRPSGPTETLGEIFKMMKIMDEDRKLNQEMASAYIEEQKHEKDRRNNEIIKALTARKPPRPPRVKKEKKVEEKKPVEKPVEKKVEEKKPPEKKEPEKKVEEKKPPEKKAPEKKAKESVEKVKEEKKAKESVEKVKEEKKAKETAEKTKEKETKKTKESAEKVKKEETKKSQEAPKTTAKKEETPSVLPSAAKVTGTAVITGTAASAIGAAEGGGNYDITFGDKVDKKGNVIAGKNMSPEKRFGKKLTDLTLEEVDMLGKERNKISPSTSAMGKYQFMNSTLFGQWKKDKNGKDYFAPGLVQQSKLDPKTTKFTPEVQEKFFNMLHEQDLATLKRLGVPTTPGYEYMAHYIGAGGAKAIYDRKDSGMTVQQALLDAKLPNPVHGETNKELATIKASDFESILAGRLNKHGLKSPHASQDTGEKLNQSSKENADGKKELNAQQAQSQQNINVINQNVNQTEQKIPDKPNDTNPLLAKVKGQPK